MSLPTRTLWSLAALATALGLHPAARADPIADFYRGRSISLILSAGVGGGYASYAQAFAPYFSAHIPGNPTIIIQNMPVLEKPFVVGGTGAGSQMETMPVMLNKLFGTKIKVISGYRGGNDIYLAMERGEIQGRCGGLISSISSTRPDWFSQKLVNVPIQIAAARNPLFPDAPAIMEFARDERTRKILQLILAPLEMDRPILAPSGVPTKRVAALREAFHAAMNDPAFIAEAEKDHLEIREVSGLRVAQILNDAFAMPAEIAKAATDAMGAAAVGGE